MTSTGTSGSDAVVLMDVHERVATITLNRPAARNALSSEVLALLPTLMREADGRDDVDVLVLTGADPAFCAGLDLKELGSSGGNLGGSGADGSPNRDGVRGPFPALAKPLIGAINGVAITGGFELALNCDFLVASEHAKFGDTHTRVGVMPGWGLTVLLVPHAELLGFTHRLAADIIGNDQAGVRQLRSTYASIHADQPGWTIEAADSAAWRKATFDPANVEARRQAIQDRGRTQ